MKGGVGITGVGSLTYSSGTTTSASTPSFFICGLIAAFDKTFCVFVVVIL